MEGAFQVEFAPHLFFSVSGLGLILLLNDAATMYGTSISSS